MEQIGAIYEGEWNSSNGMRFEEADFMAQLLGTCSIPSDIPNGSHFQVSPAFLADGIDGRAIYSSDHDSYNTSMYSFLQGSSYSGGSFFPFPSHESFSHQVFANNNNVMDHGDEFLNQDVSNDSMESDDVLQEKNSLQLNIPSGSKKRSRIPGEVEKNKRSVKNKKCKKIEDSNGEENNNNNRRSLSYCCSEDEPNGKTRANRGSATDPQSLYARKRRERINERLRMLQKLVPNGTKVDISTMLEEAVQYVKFLQLQIKLLSSDDLWMYAPIAYNGMDLGSLNLKAN